MRKVIGVFVLVIALNAGYLNFASKAQGEYQCENLNGQRVCFAKEIMEELVKEAIYHAGSKVLDKMKNNEFEKSSSASSSSTTSTSNSSYSNYVDNSSSNNNDSAQEEMIPI